MTLFKPKNLTPVWRLRERMNLAGFRSASELHREIKKLDPDSINFAQFATLIDEPPACLTLRTITALAMPARRRETQLTELIYQFHPRFAGVRRIHGWDKEFLEGGDVLALGEGVLAVGVGERTRPAGAERLARTAFVEGLAHTVLAVPIDQDRATMHLDTICTMVDRDAMVMYPNVAHRLGAVTIKSDEDGDLVIEPMEPFLDAAARAMGIDRLRLIDTGLDPVTAEREQWDDGNNTLAIEPRVAIAYERNVETNERLAAAGIEVIAISGSELGSGRGGPRCMSCPISRDPL